MNKYPEHSRVEMEAAPARKPDHEKPGLPKPPFSFGDLSGPEGNAYSILGKFQEAARRAGWPKEEIDRVIQQAVSGDYEHLLRTISDNVSEQ